MQIVSNTPAALLDISAHAAKVELDADDKKTIAATAKQLRGLASKAPDTGGTPRSRMKEARYAVGPDFKPEAVLRLKIECALAGQSDDIFKRQIKQIITDHHRQILANAELGEIAASAIDQIAEGVRSDATAHAEALAKSPLAGDVSSSEANARVSRTLDWLGEQRGKAIREGGETAWGILQDLGLA